MKIFRPNFLRKNQEALAYQRMTPVDPYSVIEKKRENSGITIS